MTRVELLETEREIRELSEPYLIKINLMTENERDRLGSAQLLPRLLQEYHKIAKAEQDFANWYVPYLMDKDDDENNDQQEIKHTKNKVRPDEQLKDLPHRFNSNAVCIRKLVNEVNSKNAEFKKAVVPPPNYDMEELYNYLLIRRPLEEALLDLKEAIERHKESLINVIENFAVLESIERYRINNPHIMLPEIAMAPMN